MFLEWHAETANVYPELCSKPGVQMVFRVQEKLYANMFLRGAGP